MKPEKKDPRIQTDRDFVLSKKHNNSLKQLLKDYPGGVPDKVICKVLQISQEELTRLYECAIVNLKVTLK